MTTRYVLFETEDVVCCNVPCQCVTFNLLQRMLHEQSVAGGHAYPNGLMAWML
jgi:hypothetical protein